MKKVIIKSDLDRFEKALDYEWLDTNGIGAFVYLNAYCSLASRYHTLLTIYIPEKNSRFNLVPKIEDSLLINKKEYYISTNQYPNSIYPNGYEYFDNFTCGLVAIYKYKVNSYVIKRSIMMLDGQNTTIIRYDLLLSGNKNPNIFLRPFLAFRDIHALVSQNTGLNVKVEHIRGDLYKMHPYIGLPSIYFKFNRDLEFYPCPDWYNNFEYHKDRDRGYSYLEDLFCPGIFEKKLNIDSPLYFALSTEEGIKDADLHLLWNKELKRRYELREKYKDEVDAIRSLKIHSKNFIFKKPDSTYSIIAGYPWFGEWARDAMIAVPGLTLYCDRYKEGLEILKNFAKYEKNGLIPNYISKDELSYNSVDTPFWFIWAVQQYYYKTKDIENVKIHLFPTIISIIKNFLDPKISYIKCQKNKLLWTGNANTNLTWMDAVAWGKPVTSRHGLAIEVNALWYNALCFFNELVQTYIKSEIDDSLLSISEIVRDSLNKEFWCEDVGYLADVINEDGKDKSLRPNQILAISLPYSAFSYDKQVSIINQVDKYLVTPYGLRSLSFNDPRYREVYKGTQNERDIAYHQGTVWAWLVGPFIEAYLKVYNQDKAHHNAKEYLRQKFKLLFIKHVVEYGLFSISEIFDGNSPHCPKGCPFQAWSVAEVIRGLELLKN